MSMFEFDKETKLRSLKIFGFEVEKLELDRILHVPMRQYRIATKEKPMLYIENLQVCVAIYAYCENFGFASHINTVVLEEGDFILNEKKIPIKVRSIENLKSCILKIPSIKEPIKIGIAIGYTPISKDYFTIKLIYEELEVLIKELSSSDIRVEHLKDQSMPEFILDTANQKIILPNR